MKYMYLTPVQHLILSKDQDDDGEIHHVIDSVSADNIETLLETVREFRKNWKGPELSSDAVLAYAALYWYDNQGDESDEGWCVEDWVDKTNWAKRHGFTDHYEAVTELCKEMGDGRGPPYSLMGTEIMGAHLMNLLAKWTGLDAILLEFNRDWINRETKDD